MESGKKAREKYEKGSRKKWFGRQNGNGNMNGEGRKEGSDPNSLCFGASSLAPFACAIETLAVSVHFAGPPDPAHWLVRFSGRGFFQDFTKVYVSVESYANSIPLRLYDGRERIGGRTSLSLPYFCRG